MRSLGLFATPGQTCEHVACPHRCQFLTARLLGKQDGSTALMIAAGNGHLEVAQWLQQAGADIHAKDKVSRAFFLATGMRLIACMVKRQMATRY
jgi:hypothetical protein